MRKNIRTATKILAMSLLIGLAGAFASGAQDKTPTATAKDKAAKETLTFSATKVESILAKGKERTILTGKAKVISGTLEIRADKIEITGENYSSIACTGAVEVKDSDKGFSLKTEKLAYDRPSQMSRTEGESTLEDAQNGVVLKAEWIEFDQKNELITAQISVRIMKEDFAARSEYALFNRKENSLIMTGVPTLKSKNGTTLSATTISGGASADKLDLEGNVSGSIVTTKQEEAPAETKGP